MSVNRPLTGAEYIESLKDGREVWIYGEKVKDVTDHPAFRNPIRSIARLYDSLHDGSMPTAETDTGSGGSTHPFFKVSRSSEDLIRSRDAIAHWAKLTYGWMGRTPDYKAGFLGTLGVNDSFYEPYDANARRWYAESQEKVLYWNHALINPPVDRNRPADEVKDVFVHVENENDNGIVVSGAKVVATGSAMTHMNLIANGGFMPIKDKRFTVCAAIPMDSPGMKLICRQSYAAIADASGSPFDYPLSSRFDENDAIIILDKVLIPWENVFQYGDVDKSNMFMRRSGFGQRLTLQGATRLAVKLDFISGLLLKSLELTGTKEFRGVQTRLGEVLAYRELIWSLTEAMVRNPEPWIGGSVQPEPQACDSYRWISTVIYPEIREIIFQDLGSALITDSDTAPVVRPLYALPAGHRWGRIPGVTLIGDAAHLAPPNGEGANLAMQDGAELGRAIAAHPGDVEAALAEYEQAMFPRAAAGAAGEDIYDIMLGDDAPHSWVAMMNDAGQAS